MGKKKYPEWGTSVVATAAAVEAHVLESGRSGILLRKVLPMLWVVIPEGRMTPSKYWAGYWREA